MAEKRMFTKRITDSDSFLDMPMSTQCLYFHLNMNADDDGFVNNPKKIQRMVGASDDDVRILISKSFVLCFENGVVVIKHWRMHNTLRKDRYKPTDYQEEFKMLGLKENNSYTWQPNGNQMEPQYSIEENSEDKHKYEYTYDVYEASQKQEGKKQGVEIQPVEKQGVENYPQLNTNKSNKEELNTDLLKNTQKKKYGEFQNVLLTDEEVEKLKANLPDWEKWIETLSHGIALKGYKYKSHYLAILKWSKSDKSNEKEVSFDVELAERQARENRVDFGTKKVKRKRGKDNDTKTENIEVSE